MAAVRPPNDYITLSEAINKDPETCYNVIGTCADFLPPAKTRGTDETIVFTLSDSSWYRGRGMKFRFFHKERSMLPAIENHGDIIMLRDVRTRQIGSDIIGLSNSGTTWAVLSASSVLDSICPHGSDIRVVKPKTAYNNFPLSPLELQYAKDLAAITDPSSFRVPSKPTFLQVEGIMKQNGGTPPPRKDKRRLLQDLNLDKHNPRTFRDGRPAFADLLGEVRRTYTGDQRCIDIYLTDYTSNPKLYNYDADKNGRDDQSDFAASNRSWRGPWGKMTIKICLWDAHAMFARQNVKEGMYVVIRNCQVKFDPNGSILEAVCRGDREDFSKVNIRIVQTSGAAVDEVVKELLRRRRDYEKLALRQNLRLGYLTPEGSGKRPSAFMTNPNIDDSQKPTKRISKAKRRKLDKQAKQQVTAEISSNQQTTTADVNQHVRCNNVEIPLTPIEKILDRDILKRRTQAGNEYVLPFQNCAYKCKVRVVDYYPDDIAQFTVPVRTSPCEELSNREGRDQDIGFEASKSEVACSWEWRFLLILEGTNASFDNIQPRLRMPVLVTGQNGDFLLREDACDLKSHPETLAKLKEKLFILWGDLQEWKEENRQQDCAAPSQQRSSRPFECLIQEYGIPLKSSLSSSSSPSLEYQRMFQLFGTTV